MLLTLIGWFRRKKARKRQQQRRFIYLMYGLPIKVGKGENKHKKAPGIPTTYPFFLLLALIESENTSYGYPATRSP